MESFENDAYRNFIFYRTYARWDEDKGRRETWQESVDRYMDYMSSKVELSNTEYTKIREAILNQDVMPSMRLLWSAGKAADKTNATAYNCSFIAPTKPQDFAEILYLLTCGCGVGFSVESKVVNQIPKVSKQSGTTLPTYVIEDSREGWANALAHGISTWLSGGDVTFDYSHIRPEGSRLKTMGGRACLTGDTIVYRDRKKTREYNETTIDELYNIRSKDIRGWFNTMKLRSLNEETGEFYRNKVLDVYKNGVQPVYKVITRHGYQIKATENHRFMDSTGEWRYLSTFNEGDEIAVNGSKEVKSGVCADCACAISRKAKRCRKCYHKNQQKEDCLLTTARQRKECRDSMKTYCERCEVRDVRLVVHHKDENPRNNNKENLETLCEGCHRKHHFKIWTFADSYAHKYLSYDEIISITHVGEEMTYDLQMDSPDNNYVANGFVSHNSGPAPLKSLLNFTREKILSREGKKLRPIDVHDIVTKIGEVVVAGGVRRSSEISLSDLYDEDMRNAKTGEFWVDNPHRMLANNSAVYEEKPPHEVFLKEWNALKEAGTGERGIFNRGALEYQMPERRIELNPKEKREFMGTNPCFAPGTLIQTSQGAYPVEGLVGKEVDIWDGSDWTTVDNFRVTGEEQEVLSIELYDGSSTLVTPYHTMILEDGSRVEAKDVEPGDRLKIADAPTTHGTKTEKGAYLKGFLVGDGTQNGTGNPLLWLYSSKYVCEDRLISSAKEIDEGNINTNALTHIQFVKSTHNRKVMQGLAPRSGELAPWAREYKKSLPKEVFTWNLNSKIEFIAGVMDADGTASDTKNGYMYQISSVYKKWLEDFQMLLKSVGVQSHLSLSQEAGFTDFNDGYGEHKTKDCWRLTISQKGSINLSKQVRFTRLTSFSNKELSYSLTPRWNKVKSVTPVGVEDKVYCCTVPGSHSVSLLGGIVTGQCGEITLRSHQFCNLTEVVARPEDTVDTLLEKARIASILGTYQSSLSYFPYLSDEWKKNCEEERLLGVSLTGYFDTPQLRDRSVLNRLKEEAVKTNEEYAEKFGINQSTSVTCVKPSGTVSQLVNASSGMHPRYAPYYIRRVRISATDPLFKLLRDRGVPHHPEIGQEDNPNTYVLEFPVKSPDTAITNDEVNAIDQLEHWKMVKRYYTEHNPSNTIYIANGEWGKVADWIWKNWEFIGGLSFLPKDDHVYKLAPYEPISEEEYEKLTAQMPEIDFSEITKYEQEDNTEGGEQGCSSGVCQVQIPA